ncbi:MAG TPA: voltage-gated chloride channel family protein [Pirellulaceae bacterium]|nr:voltage-gated chloride channel family protein [Pirellulaceae bacterium]
MPILWDLREHGRLARYVLKWLAIGIPVGLVIGSAVALFLWLLDWATNTRYEQPWLLYLLPVMGLAIGALYHLLGKSVDSGNNLIIEQIHEPNSGVPTRMAPLILLATVATHLCGGSAGREGTAVQMGGSLAATLGRWLRLSASDTRTLLMAGLAGGFGAVFGTPLTGAIFALEVLAIGRLNYEALIPCLIASIVGDWTTAAWGVPHTHYHIAEFAQLGLTEHVVPLSWLLAGKVAIAAMLFGLASVLFSELTHGCHRLFKNLVPSPMLRPFVGGLLIIGLVHLLGTRDYLGLGVAAPPDDPNAVTILSCFRAEGAFAWSWWWKIVFTVVTLSSGFKGGEVTPLFFIGAALGNTLALLLGAPIDLFAGLGFVAVFAGATNTPLACTIMAIELFAPHEPGLLNAGFIVYVAIACFLAYLFSGHTGIYLSQLIGSPKAATAGETAASLREHREQRAATSQPRNKQRKREHKNKRQPEL